MSGDRGTATSRAVLIRNGVIAFVTGAAIMVLLHESSHAVAGMLLGHHPVQLPFAVTFDPEPPAADAAITAITGPLFSLVTGLIALGVDRAVRPFSTRPYARLVWWWTVFASLEEGFGYFFIAGIVSAGDTAQAFRLWGLPGWTYVVATVFGIGGLFLNARFFANRVTAVSTSLDDKRAIAVWPWLYGTVIAVVLEIAYVLLSPRVGADDVVAVMAGTIAIGVYAPLSMIFLRRRYDAEAPLALPVHPRAGYVLLGVLVVINLLLTRAAFWP